MLTMVFGVLRVVAWTMVIPWTIICAFWLVEMVVISFNLKRPNMTMIKTGKVPLDSWRAFSLFLIEGILIGVLMYAR